MPGLRSGWEKKKRRIEIGLCEQTIILPTFGRKYYYSSDPSDQALDQNEQDQRGEHKLEVGFQPAGELQPLTGVGLL